MVTKAEPSLVKSDLDRPVDRTRMFTTLVVLEVGFALLLIGVVVFIVLWSRAPQVGPHQSVAAVSLPPPLPERPTTKRETESLVPYLWMPTRGNECENYNGREVCHGPRKVPLPRGEADELAQELGLGTRGAAKTLLRLQEPPMEWVLAVSGLYREHLRWPVDGGRFWRGFGDGFHGSSGDGHNGVDIGAPAGTHILAAADGLVAYSDNEIHGYGNAVLLLHADGTVTLYGHCRATYVFAGQQVHEGQVIGEVGTTGISRGNHLHFELRRNGEPLDPMPLLQRWISAEELEAESAIHSENMD